LVAEEAGQIVGAIGGGLLNSEECEVFVLYLNPEKKKEKVMDRLCWLNLQKFFLILEQKNNGYPLRKTIKWAYHFMRSKVLFFSMNDQLIPMKKVIEHH
jgi:hypothetical protein